MPALHRNSDLGCARAHPACLELKLGSPGRLQGIQTRAGSAILRTAPWWWWWARPMRPLSRAPSRCSSSAFFSISSARHLLLGTVRARNRCIAVLRRHDRGDLFISSRSRSVRCHRRWFRYGRFQTRNRAGAPSGSRAPPRSALSLGCYSQFRRHAPGMM
jgi:hypothetical protein